MVSKPLKLMIVDDDPNSADYIHYMLKDMPFEIRKAYSGKEAISILIQSPPAILITDIYMTDITGVELMKSALNADPDILCIGATGYGDIDIAVDFMKQGGIDFLQKPVSKYALINSVKQAEERYRLRKELRTLNQDLKQKNILLHQEIERRKEAQEALQKSEQQYRDIFENAPIGIFQASLKGKFININPAMAKMAGFLSPDDMIASIKNMPEQGYEKIFKQIHQTGWTTFEEQFFRKDKSVIFARVMVRLVKDEAGEPLYLEGFFSDITEEKHRQEIFQLEMARATELYELAMTPQLPSLDGASVYIRCIPTEHIGGDVVDILQPDENTLLIFLADVTGHGIPAALTANTLRVHLREKSDLNPDPAAICRYLNKTMPQMILRDDMIAAFCARIDLKSLKMTYCLCGIPSPIIIRNNEIIRLKPTGPPLGVFEDQEIITDSINLNIDDMLIAFTDGITDIRSHAGIIFGSKGVENSIRKIISNKYPYSFVEEFLKETIRFQRKDYYNDDVILLSVNLYRDNLKHYNYPICWNHFCETNKCIFKCKTRYIDIDQFSIYFINHIGEKYHIPLEHLQRLKVAFFELLTNAVEHGNLEMTEMKNKPDLYDSEKYREIFENRMKSDKYGNRLIQIESSHKNNEIEISIQDDGIGFNINLVDDPTIVKNIHRSTGRGIYLARMSVDKLGYNQKGNRVSVICSR